MNKTAETKHYIIVHQNASNDWSVKHFNSERAMSKAYCEMVSKYTDLFKEELEEPTLKDEWYHWKDMFYISSYITWECDIKIEWFII